MVCLRCKIAVIDALQKVGLQNISVDLGVADVKDFISAKQLQKFKALLMHSGLEVMDDEKHMLVEKIKHAVIDMVLYTVEPMSMNFSLYLSTKLKLDYTYMANVFSKSEGVTIEHFVIAHKIERVKALLIDSELNLTEIAYLMHYSSVAHVSAQFKKVTGITPTDFMHFKKKKRVMLDRVGIA